MIQKIWKGIVLLLAAVLVTGGLLGASSFAALGIIAAPDDGGRVPYQYHFDSLHTASGGNTIISVHRNMQLDVGQPLKASGWLATAEGVAEYRYLWLPVGGGNAEWQTVTDCEIQERYDLASSGIPYASGHGTAGFSFAITPPEGLPEGYYDVYIRALDGMGVPCDLAAILNLRYGTPDVISDSAYRISFPRLSREGEPALFGGASVTDEAILLPPDGGVRLGTLNMAGFEAVKISYEITNPDAAGKLPILGLKSAGAYSYGKGDEGYNVTHDLAYTPISADLNEIVMDLKGCDEYGEVWLTGHLNCDVRITKVEFVRNGYGTNRVAARIRFSGDLINTYFTGNNRTNLLPITDPVLGDVLRMEVKEETNDPYAYFNAGGLLKDHGIILDADEYKYMVILYRADTRNNTGRMNLYLCAGMITGATEECNQGVTLTADGKWHYLLVDLTQRANWNGVINGWRFDYISGASDVGDGVDFATVQFFRTSEAAIAAAKQDPAKGETFHLGDAPVVKDMCEEQGAEDDEQDPVIDPDDIYEITEPSTEPPVEPPTDPEETTVEPPVSTDSVPEETAPSLPSETTPEDKGCRSALSISAAIPLLCASPFLLRKREKISD